MEERWDRLREVLARQLALVREDRLEAAAELGEQTQPWVQRLAAEPAAAESTAQRQSIERLYRDLCLALTARRAEVSEALNTIRRGQRLLELYSRSGHVRR